ncbi:nicotinamide-nucleotide amidase [Paramixta manurensis]|uniref:Nicotinamide-nucleotide amidase n=1 Tax=Paramixta manurensis TaxID=2740817 RepID=A0A6M8UIW9_9GAMM|nr:nicotinamide-nucleotide amidase [Erwiniaceae bacterium PD-1]
MTDDQLTRLGAEVGALLRQQSARVTTAESCTGGWIAKTITDVAGSSAWFDCAFITYSNDAKQRLVGVQAATLEQWGAVSEQVVTEMAAGALQAAGADFALSVSGIAGPDGGSEEKPVGTVWFGFVSARGQRLAQRRHFVGDREAVRRQATVYALTTLRDDFLKK